MSWYDTPSCNCPTCHTTLYEATEGTTTQDKHPPRAGDIAICWHCGEILLVDDISVVRLPTDTELIEIKSSKQWPAVEEISLVYRNRRIS